MNFEIDTETDDLLTRAAQDGFVEHSFSWPRILPALISRIHKTAHNDFPIPHIPPPRRPARGPSPRLSAPLPSSDPVEAPDSSQETNKENANPSPSTSRTSAPNDIPSSSTALSSTPPNPTPQPEPLEPGTLPPPVAALLYEITRTLTHEFAHFPPHTIQRLSELILRPKQHYRHLVPYLHALDRVVHVTSGANIYPLPPAVPDKSAMSVLANGVGGSGNPLSINSAIANNIPIGSDEALGGALLTPIPWLARRTNGGGSEDGSDAGSSSPLSSSSGPPQQQIQMQPQQQPQQQSQAQRQAGSSNRKQEPQLRTESTETIEGPNGMGSIETVTISIGGMTSTTPGTAITNRGVTQGELLRQEQRAGVVPLSQLARQQQQGQGTNPPIETAEDEDSTMAEDAEEEERPHARGPEEIGPEDMGPQSATSSTYTGDVMGIDVEAAVGRRLSPSEQDQQQQDPPVPKSPKREAKDEFESPPVKKRASESEDDGAKLKLELESLEEEPKKDAEGDVVIEDPDDSVRVSIDASSGEKGDPDVKMEDDGTGDNTVPKEDEASKSDAEDIATTISDVVLNIDRATPKDPGN